MTNEVIEDPAAIADAAFAEWLDDPHAQRVTLYNVNCEVNGVPTVRRFSNRHYSGGLAASPYLAVVEQDLELNETISMGGAAQLTASDVVLKNDGGEFDGFYDDVWANLTTEVYVGDIRWPLTDFKLMSVVVAADVAPGSADDLIVLKFRDMFQMLNAPVSDDKLTGDVLWPRSLGEVANMTPQYDPATDKWYYHKGQVEGIIEVRTDGKRRLPPNEITDYPAEGCFKFNVAVGGGAVTCSVQGDKSGGVYRNTISSLIQLLVTSYGKAETRFTAANLDTANLAAFETANPQPVGLPILDRTNVLTACAQLAASKGAQMIPSRLGKVRLIQFAIPTTATKDIPLSMQADQGNRLVMISRTTPKAVVKIAYCKNYTPQANLGTSLPPAHKQMFAAQWRTYTTPPAPGAAKYKQSGDVEQEETLLLRASDAQVEGLRRRDIMSVPRHTFRVELLPPGLLLELGQAVRLFGVRYNLSAGKIGLVVGLRANFGTYRTTVEVTI